MANNPEDDRYAYNPSEEEFQQKLEQFDNSTTRAESDKKPGRLESYRQKSEDAKAKLREAENADWNDPANGFYKPSEKAQARINNWRNWSSRRKLAVGGGAAAGVSGLLISMFALLPMKIPGIMSMITDEAGQRVEQVTEHRAKLILARAILRKFDSDLVVTGKGTFSTLVASMRTSNFEKRLAEKGLKITRDGDGVRLTNIEGKALGGGKVLKNEVAIVEALDADQLTNRMIKDIVKEDIPSWRWVKRAKFAKWLRIKYGIPRYGLNNSSETNTDDAIKEMEQERLKSESDQSLKNATDFLNCLSTGGEECVLTEDGSTKDSTLKDSANTADVSDTLSEASDEAIKETLDNPGEETSKLMTKIISNKFATKAIPIVGWIDLAATINHLVKEEAQTDFVGKAVAGLKSANYAQLYGNWSGYASQNQLGALRPDYIATLAKQTDGVEQAQAFNMIEGKTKSNATALLSTTAYAVSPSDIPGVPVDRIDANNPSLIKQKMDSFNSATGGVAGIAGKPTSFLLEGWYQTLGEGGIGGFISGWLGGIITNITPDAVTEWAGNLMNKLWQQMLDVFGLDYNPFVSGAKWFNNAHAGATASFNTYAKETGMRKLSPAQASAQNEQIAQERAAYRAEKGPLYALFSPQETTSLTSQLAIHTPTNTNDALTSLASLVTSAPHTLFASLTPKNASAANAYVDLYGVDPYGATQADMDAPLTQEFINGDTCPGVAEGSYDSCKVDNEIASAMICEFQPDIDGCSDEGPGAGSEGVFGAGSQFRIASYNVLGAIHTASYEGRMDKVIANINSKDLKIDIVGFQEFERVQRRYFMQHTTNFALYPSDVTSGQGENAIGWDKTKFKFVQGGMMPKLQYFGNGYSLDAPWVKLEDLSTGQQLYVLNTHDPAHDRDGYPKKRYENALQHVVFTDSLKSTGLPVLFTGDFNSGYELRFSGNSTYQDKAENLTYCIITQAGFMNDAYDVQTGRDVKCPNPGNGNSIDHVYVSNGIKVDKYRQIAGGAGGSGPSGSDHDVQLVDINIPAGEAGSGEWSLPVDKSAWKTDGQRWLEAHTTMSDAWTNSIKAAADINIGSGNDDCGKPIYSMLAGTMVKSPPTYTAQVRSVVNGKEVLITYAHGKNMKAGGASVQAGEKIGEISNNANPAYGTLSCHLHLEVKYGTTAICPQNILPDIALGKEFDLSKVPKAVYACSVLGV